MLPDDLARSLGLEGELSHLEEALTHPSFSNEQRRGPRFDNQRLEFLGDSVLGLCVTELLMERFPRSNEGDLSRMRSLLVNTDALASWARGVSLGAFLKLGKGADAAGEREQTNVLADAVEAVVGAVFLDRGLDTARLVTRTIVADPLARLGTSGLERDPKSELQERVQAAGGASPRYRVVSTEGPDHSREFVVVVEVLGEVVGEGRGRSKKLAEQAAARAALARPTAGDPTSALPAEGSPPVSSRPASDAEAAEPGPHGGTSGEPE